MKFIYMNHRIREKKPSGPVIVVQHPDSTVEANTFEISVGGQIIGFVCFDPKGLAACETHEVKAWVEFNDNVEVRPYGKAVCTPLEPKPVAEAKEPNKPVFSKPLSKVIKQRIKRYRAKK